MFSKIPPLGRPTKSSESSLPHRRPFGLALWTLLAARIVSRRAKHEIAREKQPPVRLLTKELCCVLSLKRMLYVHQRVILKGFVTDLNFLGWCGCLFVPCPKQDDLAIEEFVRLDVCVREPLTEPRLHNGDLLR